MDNTYGEFQGTELDPSLDFDFDDEEENDLLPILGIAALFASIVGGVLMLIGRRRQPTATERAQEALAAAGSSGKKAVKAAAKAAEDIDLRDMLDEAIDRARKVSQDGNVSGLLKEARSKAEEASKRVAEAAKRVDVKDVAESASDAGKKAAKGVAALGIADVLKDAVEKAVEASRKAPDLAEATAGVRKQAGEVLQHSPLSDLDTERAGRFLDDLKEKLVEAIESARHDVAPKAADTFRSSVVPAAQETVQTVAHRVQEDVIPAAQGAFSAAQERAGKLADQYEVAPRARKAAEAAVGGATSLGEMFRNLALGLASKWVEEMLPQAKQAGKKAATVAREDVIPAAAGTATHAATLVREEVIPKVTDVAAHTPGMLGDLLAMAREKAGEALDKTEPRLPNARDAAVDAAKHAQERAKGLAKAGKSEARGVGGAVSTAVSATTHATREFTGVLFWLAALGVLILLAFVPDRDKQEEIWNNVRQFLGEVREMWRDLQGPEDYELETGSDTDTVV